MGRFSGIRFLSTIRTPEGWRNAGHLFTKKNADERGSETLTDYKEYRLTLTDWLREGTIGTLLDAVAAYSFYRSLTVFLVLLPAAWIGFPLFRRKALLQKRTWELQLEFREAIWLLSGYLSAGLSVENAFAETVPELKRLYGEKGMITREFGLIVRNLGLNKPVEPMLTDFAQRSGIADIRSFAEVFGIALRSGGNMQEIIERTTSVIRDKTTVAEEIRSMTAARRYEQNIMNILPFLLIIYIRLTSGTYLDVMYESFAGRVVMTVCLLLLAAGYLLSQKILEIPV